MSSSAATLSALPTPVTFAVGTASAGSAARSGRTVSSGRTLGSRDDAHGGDPRIAAVVRAAHTAALLSDALPLGDLLRLRSHGAVRIEAEITTHPDGGTTSVQGRILAGSGLSMAASGEVPPSTPARAPWDVPAGVLRSCTAEQVRIDHAVRHLHHTTRAAWTVLTDARSAPLRMLGQVSDHDLQVAHSRCTAVARTLARSTPHHLWLEFTHGTVVVIPYGDATILSAHASFEPTVLATVIDEVRGVLEGRLRAANYGALPASLREPVPLAAPEGTTDADSRVGDSTPVADTPEEPDEQPSPSRFQRNLRIGWLRRGR